MRRNWMTGIFCLIGVFASAQIVQRDLLDDGKVQLMLSPQHIAIQQLRIDVDVKLAPKHWLQISPHYVEQTEQSKRGIGLNLYYRWYYAGEKAHYLSGGINYTWIHHNRYAYDPAIMQEVLIYNQESHRYGVQFTHGHNLRILPRLYVDIYYGLGYRFRSAHASDGLSHPSTPGWLSYDKTGFHLVGGVRIGFLL